MSDIDDLIDWCPEASDIVGGIVPSIMGARRDLATLRARIAALEGIVGECRAELADAGRVYITHGIPHSSTAMDSLLSRIDAIAKDKTPQ